MGFIQRFISGNIFIATLLVAFFAAFPFTQAHAACTSPAANAGEMDFVNAGDEQVFKYCDGDNWVSWGGEEVTGMPAPLSSTASLGGITMVDGWPDALVCNLTSPNWGEVVIPAAFLPYNNGKYQYQLSSAGNYINIEFNNDGTYSTTFGSSGTTTDCNGKSISQLYTDDQAFNFVGGGSGGGVGGSVAWSDITGIPAGFADGTDDGGGAANLPDLGDVSISSPANGDSLVFNGSSWINQAGGSDTLAALSCTDGQVAAWNNSGSAWECADQTVGGGSGGSVFTMCTNEQSDGDGTSDVTACVEARDAQSTGYRVMSCHFSSNFERTWSGDHIAWNSTKWQFRATGGTYYDCVDGSVVVANLNASNGGGGSDTLAGLSCTDGQVAAWNATGSAWECADAASGASGSGSSTMIDGWPDAITCNLTSPAWGNVTFYPFHMPYTANNLYYYRNNNGANNYDISFNADKTFQGYANITSADCNKSIAQLYTDGQAFNFVGGGGSSPGGVDKQVQFNDGGSALGGDAKFTWNKATSLLSVDGDIIYTGALTDTSDARLKENVAALSSDIFTKVKALEPVSFTMKATPDAPPEFGFMAQDVRELFPNLVVEADDEMKTLSLNYQGMIALLVKSVQEMERENVKQRESFAAELQSLRAEIETLKQASTGE